MNEFEFERSFSPWEHAYSHLQPGGELSALRFLELMACDDSVDPEQALQELEEKQIELDIRQLPQSFSGADADRLRLEAKCWQEGSLEQNLGENDPLYLCLQQLKLCASPENEDALACAAARGDEAAMAALTDGYLPDVMALAGQYLGYGVLLMDLVQEGSLGLWQSVLRFTGGPFRPYALAAIRRAMSAAVTLQAHAGGVGERMRAAMEDYRAADKVLLTRLGRNPSEEEIAQQMGVTPEEAMAVGKVLRQAQTMEQVRKAAQPPKEEPEDQQAVEDTAYFQSRRRIEELLSGLDSRSAELISLRFGLDGQPPMTHLQAAQKLGITADEVKELEAAAMQTLRSGGWK